MSKSIIDQYISDESYQDIFDELQNITRRVFIEGTDDILLDSVENFITLPINTPHSEMTENVIPDPVNKDKSVNFSRAQLLISPTNDKTLYKCPSEKSIDARKIWINAKIPNCTDIRTIEVLLLDWAFNNAYLEIYNNTIHKIIWTSNSNCKYEFTWKSFLRWMTCASLAV
jgi:hypothetical protein